MRRYQIPDPVSYPQFRSSGEEEGYAAVSGLAKKAKKGHLVRIRAGLYTEPERWNALGHRDQHLALVLATAAATRTEVMFSHRSATALFGFPVLGRFPEKCHITERHRGGGSCSGGIVRHGVRKVPEPVRIGPVLATSPARTVIDLARTETFESALMAMDSALRSRLATPAQIEAELEATAGLPGHRRAALVVAHADGRSESPGESLSRARLLQLGAPLPILQRDIFDAEGFIGRVDFFWEELLWIGEFDGLVKYDGDSKEIRSILVAEKLREDRIRGAGVSGFLRWTWIDALTVTPFEKKLRQSGILAGSPTRRLGLR